MVSAHVPYSNRGKVLVDRPGGPAGNDKDDLLIYALGYEQRSRHVAERHAGRYKRAIGIRFNKHERFSFRENLEWSELREEITIETAESEIAAGQVVFNACEPKDGFRVVIDVSSFPRTYLAEIVSVLWRISNEYVIELSVQFMYSVPAFTEPALEHGPVVSFGAVRPDFVGLSEAGWGLATLIGLGYEPDLALSAQQVLDPAITWLAVPRSEDGHFDDEVNDANRVLMDVVDLPNIWSYDVADPATTFYELESIVSGLGRGYNVVLVPFGPKLFAIVCLLVSLAHQKTVGIWRLSAGSFRDPRDQFAVGPIYSLYVRFRSEAQTA